MPPRKRTVHPGEPTPSTPPIAEPPTHAGSQSESDAESVTWAGPWDLDPNWTDEPAEIDDLTDEERFAAATALLGWADLEPLDIDALIGRATRPDQWGFNDTSDHGDISEDVDDTEDQL
jgi:hypothetical protein